MFHYYLRSQSTVFIERFCTVLYDLVLLCWDSAVPGLECSVGVFLALCTNGLWLIINDIFLHSVAALFVNVKCLACNYIVCICEYFKCDVMFPVFQ